MKAKILVGCPTSIHKKYCIDEYLHALRHLTYQDVDVVLVDNSPDSTYSDFLRQKDIFVLRGPYLDSARERIVASRNILREYILEKGYEYFLSLEQDVIPPKDIIEKLLSCRKPVATGVYCKEYTFKKGGKDIGKTIMPLLYKRVNEEYVEQLKWKDVEEEKVFPVAFAGLGCMLIHRDILKQIAFRFVPEKMVFDDVWFCEDLQKHHIPLYVNTAVKCRHLIRAMDWDPLKK